MTHAAPWTIADLPDQTGRTTVVTGASSGLGVAITRHLAGRGGRVIMAVRDTRKGDRVRRELRADNATADLDVRHLDLLDLDTVHRFVDGLRADRVPVDALVNNGGIGSVPRRLSPQGAESQLATNHLGHFTLTVLLLDHLSRGRNPVVVTVASGLYRLGRLDLADLAAERRYSPGGAYATSKLANVLFALELDRRLRAAGSPVRSLLAHPGMARTDLDRNSPPLTRAVGTVLGLLLRRPIDDAVTPILYAATETTAPTNRHIGPGRPWRPARPTFETLSGPATDPDLAVRLWSRSAQLTGVDLRSPVAER
ncbi:SDR family NAD(P)-dependent oxidoreductase [Micromonospora echinofusca]|uniref:SDR family NAD(P)-dependent oxidoreductase n=1 Tax=Micromonospora echinofusca TaxID=47858 RepID=A0ABS3VMW7_MICEH|nr:SDR family NAD(P)-dependent oxidoreductase [Micromonospora echinofusca]MBO4205885.1 SDR family NAD(P)-dependent oxidoreductase [Micromonospora echinofusca]